MAKTASSGAEASLPGPLAVDIVVACSAGDMPPRSDVETWVARAIAGAGRVPDRPVEVAVRVVAADEMRHLNSTYRDKDAPTNVLAFPGPADDGLPDDESLLLGDLVICAAVVAKEAADQSRAVPDHWAHMLVHGTLHLLGFDHDTEAAAAVMEELETRVLAAGGIADPYAS